MSAALVLKVQPLPPKPCGVNRKEAQSSGAKPARSATPIGGFVLGVEGIVQGLFERRQLRNRGMRAIGLRFGQILRKMGAKVLGVAIARRIGRRVAPRQVLERLVAKIGVKQLVVVLRELDQAQNVGVPVKAELHAFRLARPIGKPRQDTVVTSQQRLLEAVLNLPKRHYSAAHSFVSLWLAKTSAAMARASTELRHNLGKRRNIVVSLDHGGDGAEALHRCPVKIPDFDPDGMIVRVDDIGAHVAVAREVELHHRLYRHAIDEVQRVVAVIEGANVTRC